jgi:ankyrin repeat protein
MDPTDFLKNALTLSPKDKLSLVLFLLGSVGYEEEADKLARLSRSILTDEQVVESISRYQFPKTGKTRLMYAAMTGNLKRLNFIADLGARVNQTTIDGYKVTMPKLTALHYASQNGHAECVRSLLDRGAMIDARGGFGGTPLHFASQNGHTACVRSLLDRGAMIDARDRFEDTPLHFASWGGHTECVRALLDRAAVIDAQDGGGSTALHFACLWDHIDIAHFLCIRGANTLLLDYNDRRTPYAHAYNRYGTDSRIALLLKSYPH